MTQNAQAIFMAKVVLMFEEFIKEIKENIGVDENDESIELLSQFQFDLIEEIAAKYISHKKGFGF